MLEPVSIEFIGYCLLLSVLLNCELIQTIHLAKMGQFYSQSGLGAVFNTQLNDALIESSESGNKREIARACYFR